MNDPSSKTQSGSEAQSDEPDIRKIIAIYIDEWPWIAVIALVFVALAAAYVLTATPTYRTNALIQVEEKGSSLGALGELSAVLTGERPAQAEVEIVKSRAVLGTAVRQRNLELVVEPYYFPVVGKAIARRHRAPMLASPLLGLSDYAWGGERVNVERLEIPRSLIGQELTLIANGSEEFTLQYDDEVLLRGSVGSAAEKSGNAIFVSELVARPNTRFKVTQFSWLDAVNKLRQSLRVSELGKQTGILSFSLEGENPEAIAATLNAVAETYLRQNVERTSEDAAQTLVFLEQQLPTLKAELDAAEVSLNQYRVRQGSIDLSLETQGLLEQVGEIERQISELELKNAELAQRFTFEHPVMQAIGLQRNELDQLRLDIEQKIRELPVAEQDALRLMRDVRVANELYMLLLNRSQELKVVRAGTVGNVRIIDRAVEPIGPVKPDKKLILSLSLVFGFVVGVFFVSVRESLNPTIRDSQDLENAVGLPVYAVIPHSDMEESLNAKQGKPRDANALLFNAASDDIAIESLRSLRTSLEFLLLDAEKSVITIGGPAPGAGKSFVSANLGALFAQSGCEVLIVDTDLRRGQLHRLFGLERSPGLAEIIRGTCKLDSVLHRSVAGAADFISTGTLPPNPSELIASARFESALGDLLARYHIVIMDAPPVLGAAEAMTLARLSAINLLVVRSEQQTPREVELAINKLRQAGAGINGFILNDLAVHSRRHSYSGYRYYRYSK